MKYFSYLLSIGFFLAFSSINAQNIMLNPGLESWTGGVPDNWQVYENITQETVTIHGGSSSAKHTSESTTKDFQQILGGIQELQEYTISYWYYDNDPAARTRIWAYWTAAGSNLPDNATELRPTTYSTDSPSWQQYSVVLNAPATADGFKFEVRVYNQDGNFGGSVFYDDFVFSGEVVINPEPTNYPTNFMAQASGLAVDLSWTDAIGAQLPDAYIIVAGTSASLPVPVDGTPIANDLDLSDGSGAINVNYGVQSAGFSNLDGNTTYYFKIYSYTNLGANIDYKTSGTAPSASATTANFTIIESENFDVSWGNWTTVSVIGDEVWDRNNTYGIGNTACARMAGYNGGPTLNEDWLISPGMNFDDYDNETLVFFNAKNYEGPDMECLISSNYAGSGDPNLANWDNLTFILTPGNWTWTESGVIDISSYGGTVYVAFKYTSNTTTSATWEVDDILITGEEDIVIDPEPSNYPTAFTATAGTTSITLDWTDAIGAQLPDAYIIFASTNSNLPVPVDGTPVPNDPNLADGSGAMNVAYGLETYTFTGLEASTTIYFSIYSYTNNGTNIDYKTDGTAPTANATTILLPEPSNYPTSFAAVASGTTINISWIDATGSQLPENYILYGGISASLPVPVDGTPVPNDPNLADGSAALNIGYGTLQASFAGLSPGVTYYFSIYPYTNSGANINYKTSGTAPTAFAETSNTVPVTIESENFNVSWGYWTVVSLLGGNQWDRDNTFGISNTPCASVTGYIGGSPPAYEASDDWLISPAMNFDDFESEKIEFFNAKNYTGPDMTFKVSTNYDGGGNPNSATWTTLPYTLSPGSWAWTSSGIIDLSAYNGTVHVAFHFTCTTASSATWEVDDIVISGEEEYVVQPEPTNYPTNFDASAGATNIELSWTDATGTQLPDAYIIFAGTNASLPVPLDGTPVPDDTNLGDGSGAINVDFGDEQAAFSGLNPNTTYYFAIYSYTNAGIDINYKTDGTAPTANATTSSTPYILYQGFDDGFNGWQTISVTGAQQWQIDNLYGFPDPPCARMSGYSGGPVANEDWLISPAMNLNNYTNEVLTFYNAQNFDTPPLELKVSTNYSGSGNPNTATWTNITFNLSPGFYEWTESGEIDLSGFNGNAVYIAFVYTSTASASATWEVDEILVEDGSDLPEPTNYPANFAAQSLGSSIGLSWDDATGAQLPEAYIILAGINSNLPVPVDGTPIANDLNLGDGSGALNVPFGDEEALFSSLDPSTTYYFAIYPYTNTGSAINYKNDGTAPTGSATTSNVQVVTVEFEDFNAGWGNWTVISLQGNNQWDRNNTFGINSSPCASVTGYIGGTPPAYENSDDWLISPAMNFDDYDNEKIVFYNAKNYTGPDMEFKISTDYDGGGNPLSANWTNIPFIKSTGGFAWTLSGDVNLSSFNGSAVYVAFHFTSTTSGSATWEVDEITITGEQEAVIKPEPTNYPTNFDAGAAATNIVLSWNDAIGLQPPDAYIIFAGTTSSLPSPTDGQPVANDLDLTDGSGALNVVYGEEEAVFSGLNPAATYYFSIYSYTNMGVNIDYKNDGTAPTASATTGYSPYILYQGFDDGFGNWQKVSVTGTQQWQIDSGYGFPDPPCARMSGYGGGPVENEDWLISPPMNLDNYSNEILTFYNAQNFDTPALECKVSTNYSGSGNPNSASWTDITFNLSPGFYEWTASGEIDLSGFNGSAVYIAFVYYSTSSASATWEVDEILVEDGSLLPEPTNYPSNFSADEAGSSILVTWSDATGVQLPEGYILYGSVNENSLPVPTDGVPVSNDADLSDGFASINIEYGEEEFVFGGLSPSTTYYFTIYPYTNDGTDIDYKNGGTAPQAEATTENVILETIEEEDFNDDWGNWTPISVLGTLVWERDNTYGPGDTPCAAMTGYTGSGYEANEDWLVSPPLNFDNYTNEVITFQNAQNYSGPALQLKVSIDYDGGGNPNSANWTTVPFTQSGGGFAWTSSGNIDLSGFGGSAVYVAFLFTNTSSGSATWELDNIVITGEQEYVIKPEPSNYPQGFTGTGEGLDAVINWTESTGPQLPDGYMIYAGTSPELPVPVDGVPVQNDSDLSDGQAAVSVPFGSGGFTFSQGLQPYSTYYFVIYPYTNYGTDRNYKNDGSAPAAIAYTTDYYDVVIEEEGFNANWGNWTLINILGWQEWDRLNQYGPDNTNCAAISGYDYGTGNNVENDDWLISPPMNFDDYVHENITFYNAKNYNGPDMQLKISTNYTGNGDPYSATWANLSYIKSEGDFDWVYSGNVDLSDYNGEEVYVAFHYTCTQSQSANWEVDIIEITGKQVLGINPQQANMAEVSIYPNPAENVVRINQASDFFNKVEIKALSGRTLQTIELGGLSTNLDVSSLSSGIYFLVMTNEENGNTHSEKLIIR